MSNEEEAEKVKEEIECIIAARDVKDSGRDSVNIQSPAPSEAEGTPGVRSPKFAHLKDLQTMNP